MKLHAAWLALILAAQVQSAPLVQINAERIRTQDPHQPIVESMLIDADRGIVVALGTREAMAERAPQAEQRNLDTATIIPGLIDAHGHLLGQGLGMARADLVGTQSIAEVIERLQAKAAELPADAWLLGRGWDQNDWETADFPTAADLDAAFPDRPVFLRRVDGHAAWANSRALAVAKRDLSGDWQPDGGRILRELAGNPSGVLVDTAIGLVEQHIPQPGRDELRQAYLAAMNYAAAKGLTGVHDMGLSFAHFEVLRELEGAGELPIRVYAHANGDALALRALCAFGPYGQAGGRLQLRAVKLYVDGALGSRGARLLADYSDEPGHRGLWVTKPKPFEQLVRRADACGLQIATHAIGDEANRMVLDTYARVKGADLATARWRIEHAQIVSPADLDRFAELGVIASMQPTHATSDMPWVPARLGPDRLDGAYAWKHLLNSGARLAFGSDFPVERVSPLLGLYAALTRQDLQQQPRGGWLPDQKLTLGEALAAFTTGAAYASFEEGQIGRLSPGYQADFVVMQRDPFDLPARQIVDLRVEQTWVAGQPVYQQPTDD